MAETGAEALGTQLTGLLVVASHTVGPPARGGATWGRGPPNQSSVRKMPTDLPTGFFYGGISSNKNSSSQMILACVELA